jgi:hypothetical protein
MATQKDGGIISGIFWMFLISILLFWLPGFGPLIAGFVGGKKSGGVFNAIIAVILPAIVLGICLFLFTSLLTGAPIIGFVAGAGSSILVLSNVGPLLIGAIIGGILD